MFDLLEVIPIISHPWLLFSIKFLFLISCRISCVIQGKLRLALSFFIGTNFSVSEFREVLKAFQISSTVLSLKLAKISETLTCIKKNWNQPSQLSYIMGQAWVFVELFFCLTLTLEIEISWSERPGRISTEFTNVRFVVKNVITSGRLTYHLNKTKVI